jgi:kynurenine formamidase
MLPNYKIVDLTHTITPDIPLWPGSPRFESRVTCDYDEGCKVVEYSMIASTGTHMDAPAHFIKNARDVADLPVDKLIAPLCIIDIRHKVKANSNYAVSAADIISWQQKYGEIPDKGVVVAYTGWYTRWQDPALYSNKGEDGIMHFPAFSLEAAKLLLASNIVGLGIDTFSLDLSTSLDFAVHNLLLKHDIYFIENLTNLDQLPAQGSFICALPLKISGGPESPARVIAFVPTK